MLSNEVKKIKEKIEADFLEFLAVTRREKADFEIFASLPEKVVRIKITERI